MLWDKITFGRALAFDLIHALEANTTGWVISINCDCGPPATLTNNLPFSAGGRRQDFDLAKS
jgi:hypothetical protein